MQRQLIISLDPIDAGALAARVPSQEIGAIVHFFGTVRGIEGGKRIDALEYECFREMAEHQFQAIFDQVEIRWSVNSLRVVHRIGVVPVGEASLWVEVASPHRGEAFAACEWLIDEMKRLVPIWKKAI